MGVIVIIRSPVGNKRKKKKERAAGATTWQTRHTPSIHLKGFRGPGLTRSPLKSKKN